MQETLAPAVALPGSALAAFVGYLLLVIAVGLFSARFSSAGIGEFFVCGRQLDDVMQTSVSNQQAQDVRRNRKVGAGRKLDRNPVQLAEVFPPFRSREVVANTDVFNLTATPT